MIYAFLKANPLDNLNLTIQTDGSVSMPNNLSPEEWEVWHDRLWKLTEFAHRKADESQKPRGRSRTLLLKAVDAVESLEDSLLQFAIDNPGLQVNTDTGPVGAFEWANMVISRAREAADKRNSARKAQA